MAYAVGPFTPLLPFTRGARDATLVGSITEPTAPARPIVIAPRGPTGPTAETLFRRTAWRPALSRKTSFATAAIPGFTVARRTIAVPRPEAAAAALAWCASTLAESTGFTVSGARSTRVAGWSTPAFAGAWRRPVIEARGNTATLERHAIHLFDDGLDVRRRDLGHCVTIADFELADAIARDPRFAGDGADQIVRADTVPLTDAEEHPREPCTAAGRCAIAASGGTLRTLCTLRAFRRTFGHPFHRPLGFDAPCSSIRALTLDEA